MGRNETYGMGEFRVIIAGSRYYDDYETLKAKCDRILSSKLLSPLTHVIILYGCVGGADTLGLKYAKERGLEVEWRTVWIRSWGDTVRARCEELTSTADALIAFPKDDLLDSETESLVSMAKEKGLAVRVIMTGDKEAFEGIGDAQRFLETVRIFRGKIDGSDINFGWLFQDRNLINAFKPFAESNPLTVDRSPGVNTKRWNIGNYILNWKVDTD